MKEPKWLKHNVVSHVHNLLLAKHGGPGGTRDDSLLKSALDRPNNKFGYEGECTLHDLAAACIFAIVRNHPFVDGNKRTAFVCGALFLELNGFTVTASEPNTVVTMEAVAAGTIDELQLAELFRSNSVDS